MLIFQLITTTLTTKSTSHNMQSTSSTTSTPKPAEVSFQTREYASSTFSDSTSYSYDKKHTPDARPSKAPRRSLRQRVKSALGDIGTSPFQYGDDEARQTAGWLTSLPPSKI